MNLHPVVQPIYKPEKKTLPLSLLRVEVWFWGFEEVGWRGGCGPGGGELGGGGEEGRGKGCRR